jgi:hypothetical protein
LLYVALTCRVVMAVTFGVSACSKARSRAAFLDFVGWLGGIAPVSRRTATPVAGALVITEIVVACAMVVPASARPGLMLAALLLTVFAVGIFRALRQGVRAPCKCFGTSTTPLGWPQIVRNVLLVVVALTGAVTLNGDGGMAIAGIVLSLVAGLLLVLPVVFYDDLAFLLQQPASPQ